MFTIQKIINCNLQSNSKKKLYSSTIFFIASFDYRANGVHPVTYTKTCKVRVVILWRVSPFVWEVPQNYRCILCITILKCWTTFDMYGMNEWPIACYFLYLILVIIMYVTSFLPLTRKVWCRMWGRKSNVVKCNDNSVPIYCHVKHELSNSSQRQLNSTNI